MQAQSPRIRVHTVGGAFLARRDPDVARTAKATEKAAAATEKAVRQLVLIKEKIGEARWSN